MSDGVAPTILTVHAHPDDEASKGAPTLAMYGSRGVRTVLVCCTGGEEGDLQNPSLAEPGQPFHGLDEAASRQLLAEMRPVELARSAEVIGFSEVVMLGYRDSGMAESDANAHPDCLHCADLDIVVGDLVEVVRRERPEVIITYGDDHSGYPHPDHIRVHEISVLAYERAGDPSWYPGRGAPYQPLKLYYSTWTRRRIEAVHRALIAKSGESPFDESWFERMDNDHRVTTRIDVTGFMWARTGALRAHATQVDPSEAFWFGLDDAELETVYPFEDWILARSEVGEIPSHDSEADLLDGINIGVTR
ncbi:MAG: PIG-L family deacetylase [Ilumatobacter sp.]